VILPSRMRSEAAWIDVCIHNISTNGLLVAAESPPDPGVYVDIRRGSRTIIGRVVWRKDHFFGVQVQGRLDINRLIEKPRSSRCQRADRGAAGTREKHQNHMAADAAIAHRLERSRRFAAAFQFVLIVAGGAVTATGMATGAYHLLAKPFAAIAAELPP